MLAQKSPKDIYALCAPVLSQAIIDSLKVEKDQNDTEKVYGNARDNSIAALGRVLKYQPETLGAMFMQGLETWLH